jgi:hypothetical protein
VLFVFFVAAFAVPECDIFGTVPHAPMAHPATHEKVALTSLATIGVGVGIGIAFGF